MQWIDFHKGRMHCLPYRKKIVIGIWILPIANLLDFNSPCYKIFTNLTVRTFTIEIQKWKFANILSHEFGHSDPSR